MSQHPLFLPNQIVLSFVDDLFLSSMRRTTTLKYVFYISTFLLESKNPMGITAIYCEVSIELKTGFFYYFYNFDNME